MKQTFKYLLVTFLAALIFYGGAGVNQITYCCSDCYKTGIAAVVSSVCCEIHKHDHEDEAGNTDFFGSYGTIENTHDCGLERVDFEWTVEESSRFVPIIPFVTDYLFSVTSISFSLDTELNSYLAFHEGDPPLISPPREYLSLLTTLLI